MSTLVDGQLSFLFSEAEITKSCVLAKDCALQHALKRRVAAGSVLNVAPCLYARTEYWKRLGWRGRHLHVMRGLSELHPEWVFCFISAAIVHGFEVSRLLPNDVHIASIHARRAGPIVHHVMKNPEVCTVDGIKVTSAVQTVLDCARYLSFPLALSVADSAVRAAGSSASTLTDALATSCKGMRGIRRALAIAQLADGKSENGGESYTRAIILEQGVKPPELQVTYVDPFDRRRTFRTDFGWLGLPTGDVSGELDGVEKSEDPAMLNGRTARDVLRAERMRESRLTALGLKVARFSFRQVRDVYPLLDILDGFGVPRSPGNAVSVPDPLSVAGDMRYGWVR